MEEGSQKQDLHRYHRLNPESSGHYPNLILVGIIVLLLNVAVFLEHKGQQTFTGRQSHQEKAARRKHTAFSNRPPTSAHSAHGVARYSHKGRYVLVSWLLYESPDTVPITLPFFLKSAGGCGADVVLLSTTDIPFAIPSNVRVHRTTKKELINRMEQNVFGGIKLDGLRGQDGNGPEGYKSIDFKPLTAILYPEVVSGYEYWGYADNDAIIGHVVPALAMWTKYIPPETRANGAMMDRFSLNACKPHYCNKGCNDAPCGIISLYAGKPSGPLCWYRNLKESNNAFRYIGVSGLLTAFNKTSAHGFDEWGNKGSGHKDERNSMAHVGTGILSNHGLNITINHQGVTFDEWYYWDGFKNRAGHGACKVDRDGKLWGWTNSGMDSVPVMMYMCHYEKTKSKAVKSLSGMSYAELDAFAANGFIWNRDGIFDLLQEKRIVFGSR